MGVLVLFPRVALSHVTFAPPALSFGLWLVGSAVGRAFGLAVVMFLSRVGEPGFRICPWLLSPASCSSHALGGGSDGSQGPCPTVWETCMAFPALGLGLAQSWLFGA